MVKKNNALRLIDNHLSTPGEGFRYTGGMVESILSGEDKGIRRPFIDNKGKVCVVVNTGRWTIERGERKPLREKVQVNDLLNRGIIHPILLTANATALRKEEWIELDRRVVLAYRQRIKAWEDLRAAATVGGFDAMGRATYEYEAMSDPGEAVVDMDGLTDGRGFQPLFQLRSQPLPITHCDFWYSQRRIRISRNGGSPLTTTSPEAAARRVGESIEKTTIGVAPGISYGYQPTGVTAHDSVLGSQIYGYANYPYRNTKTNFTAPNAGGWNPDTTVNEVLAALNQLYDDKIYGPFIIYYSTDWGQYMNRTYSYSGGNNQGQTLRDVLMRIEDIQDVKRLDFLTSTFTLLIVDMTGKTAQAINGQEITTLQWESVGGLKVNFKVMAIQCPLIQADYDGNCGILHGTTS